MNTSHTKDLSIQISLNGLSFSILDRSTNTIEFLHHVDFVKKSNPIDCLEQLIIQLQKHLELSQDFSSVMVIYQNELSNLIPGAYYEEAQSADYLKFNSKILSTDFISHDTIAINDSVNVYVPYVNINNYILDTFGEFEYKHASTILIETLLKYENTSFENSVILNFNAQNFELIAIRDKNLQMYNNFEYTSKEDVIYYLLFTMEQLQFNPETAKVKLLGSIAKDDDIFALIFKYVRFVDLYNPSYPFKFKDGIDAQTKQKHAILLNSY